MRISEKSLFHLDDWFVEPLFTSHSIRMAESRRAFLLKWLVDNSPSLLTGSMREMQDKPCQTSSKLPD